jgi:hypothetical protein
VRQFSITVQIKRRIDNEEWSMTGVYGPQLEGDKMQFLQELRDIRPTAHERWVLLGDFNLICRMSDKSNNNVNRRLLNQFGQVLEVLEMKELHLHDHLFTWTSGTRAPTQTKIDHIFVTKDWGLMYTNGHLQAGATSISDHCPMVLTCNPFHIRYRGFRFESFWLQMPEFRDLVAESWAKLVSTANKARTLHIKLARLAKILKHWHKQNMVDNKESTAAQELVLKLDQL